MGVVLVNFGAWCLRDREGASTSIEVFWVGLHRYLRWWHGLQETIEEA